MLYNKFEIVAKGLFGSSWKKQMADNLFIDQRRIQDWSKRDTELPGFVSKELPSIAERRALEIEFSRDSLGGLDYHKYAVVFGEIHHLDSDLITKEDIELFVVSQKYCVLQQSWKMKDDGYDEQVIKQYCEEIFLSTDDIAEWCSESKVQIVDIEWVQELRAEALEDVLNTVERWY